ncbi:MAG: hypothetical protein M3R04_08620 [bacterium]|nr:hypothetical protein [bacterium]
MQNNEQLVKQYLDVVNRSLQANSEGFPWKQIIAKGESTWSGKNIGLGINEPGRETPETYTLTFANGKFVYGGPGKVDTSYTWEADKGFLENVVAKPQEYIDSPMKINWDWIKSSLNIGDAEIEQRA